MNAPQQEGFFAKLIRVLFHDPIVDWLNRRATARTNNMSSDEMLQRTTDSRNTAFAQAYRLIKDTGGDVNVAKDEYLKQVAVAQRAQQKAINDAQAAERITDPAKRAAADRLTIASQQMADAEQEAADTLHEIYQRLEAAQQGAELDNQLFETETRLGNAKNRAEVIMEMFAQRAEKVYDMQLRAAGILKQPQSEDFSAQLHERRIRQEGKTGVAGRMAAAKVGQRATAPVSDEELALLQKAREMAGIAPPAAETKKADDQTTAQS